MDTGQCPLAAAVWYRKNNALSTQWVTLQCQVLCRGVAHLVSFVMPTYAVTDED